MFGSDDSTEPLALILPGTQVSHYRVERQLGSGGMGDVYLAYDPRLDRSVAIKFMPHRLAHVPEYRKRFDREARAAAVIDHPNVITIHDVGTHNDIPFMIMEFLEGPTLREIARSHPLSISEILEVASGLCRGLEKIHACGIIHRDVKSANVVIDENNTPVLIDFGLARITGADNLTGTRTPIGTLAYMAPEFFRGENIDHRSDIYSLGIVLYELLAGKTPYRGDSEATTIGAILGGCPPSVLECRADVTHEVADIVNRLIRLEADERFQTAGDILSAIRSVISDDDTIVLPSRKMAPEELLSLAVLPFDNLTGDVGQQFFCDGITEEIISHLSGIPRLRVVARTSVFALHAKSMSAPEIVSRLNAKFVLEGSVRQSKEKLRISVKLIEVESGFQVWSETYARELDEIFSVQDDIAKNVVDGLKVELTNVHLVDVGIHRSRNVEAYDAYLKGRYFLNERSDTGINDAVKYFNLAIRLDPQFVLAHVGRADAYFLMFSYDLMEPNDAIASSRHSLFAAREVDDKVPEALTTLAAIRTYYDWDFAGAEQLFETVNSAGNRSATNRQWFGEMLSFVGRYREAEIQFKRALEIDAMSYSCHLMAGTHFVNSLQYDKARQSFERAISLSRSNEVALVRRGMVGHLSGEESFLEYFRSALEAAPNSEYVHFMFGHALALAGMRSEAENQLNYLLSQSLTKYVPPSFMAVLSCDLGNHEGAYTWLLRSIRERDSEILYLTTMPFYRDFRSDPVLSATLKVVGNLVNPLR